MRHDIYIEREDEGGRRKGWRRAMYKRKKLII